MNQSLKPRKDAVRAEYHAFDRSIVGEHSYDHIAARAASLGVLASVAPSTTSASAFA